jgi:hypothetical protein
MTAKQIPIVVSGYNRPEPLTRILGSLHRARYPHGDVKLYISLDKAGPNGAREVAEAFEWSHGTKHVLARQEHLGMRNHAFACMDLFEANEHLVFLEDDSVVGRDFYHYVVQAVQCMDRLDDVFATSLYAFDFCEYDGLRFSPVPTEEDFFLMKSATTWGVLFSARRWKEFREWHKRHDGTDDWADHVPGAVNEWPATSWKKYINRYLSAQSKSYLYPYVSHLSHFADAGTHFDETSGNFQVPVMINNREARRSLSCDAGNLVRYDEFWEFMPPKWMIDEIGIDFECDLRRIKTTKQFRKDHVVTTRDVAVATTSYDASLFPFEMNVYENRAGDDLHMARAMDVRPQRSGPTSEEVRKYMKNIGRRREIELAVDGLLRKLRLRG